MVVVMAAALLGTAAGCAGSRCDSAYALGNLGPAVNSPYDDYAPSFIDTSTLILTSTRIESGQIGLRDLLEQKRKASIYFSMRLGQGWDEAARYRLMLEGMDGINGTICQAPQRSPFGAIAWVGACGQGGAPEFGCDLYAVVERTGEMLVNPGEPINTTAWEGHPFVTLDGLRLYFASDRPGGLGGVDIWYCDATDAGSWGPPTNAGPAVNTSADELSPFLDQGTRTLYCAAYRPGSGLDIVYWREGMSTRAPLPSPYNSPSDDFTPCISGGRLYLASNRDGGCGGFDLYGFPSPH